MQTNVAQYYGTAPESRSGGHKRATSEIRKCNLIGALIYPGHVACSITWDMTFWRTEKKYIIIYIEREGEREREKERETEREREANIHASS